MLHPTSFPVPYIGVVAANTSQGKSTDPGAANLVFNIVMDV